MVDDLLKSMSRSRRQSINRHLRRAQDRGVSVGEASAEEIRRYLPGQVTAVYERQRRSPLYKPAEIRSLTERLASHPRSIRELKTSLGADAETAVRAFQFHPQAAYKAAAALRHWGPVRDNWDRMRQLIGD
jgi:hypothetical protein